MAAKGLADGEEEHHHERQATDGQDGERPLVAAYDGDGSMVGFARALSDGVALAYLADVYLEASARGSGLGAALVRFMIDDGPGAGFRWMLHTADAHGLYRKLGFVEPGSTLLERPRREA